MEGKIIQKFDILIVGAGTAGAIAARFAAKSGFSVCLLDSKPKNKIGDKICGDAVGTEIFDFLKIPHPKGEEKVNDVKGGLLYSPDLKTSVKIKDPRMAGYIVDRIKFGQRLLDEALSEGVTEFHDSTHVLSPILENKKVIGVNAKGSSLNGEEKIYGNLVIDAGGFHSPLKKFINSPYLEQKVADSDAIVCYREILDFKGSDITEDTDYISIFLNQERAPGGYVWYFPRNDKSVNLGLGVDLSLKNKVKDYYQREAFDKFIGSKPYDTISSGGGIVSVCRPMYTMVADGIVFAGDAASQVNPLHGGGIDPSMRGGYYAIEAYKSAAETEKFDEIALWKYNELVQKDFGGPFAALDLLRITLQNLSNDQLNFGLRQGLLSGEEIIEIATKGELTMDLFGMINKTIKGFSRPLFLLDLKYLNDKMAEIKRVYDGYPRIPRFLPSWITEVEKIYSDIKKKFQK